VYQPSNWWQRFFGKSSRRAARAAAGRGSRREGGKDTATRLNRRESRDRLRSVPTETAADFQRIQGGRPSPKVGNVFPLPQRGLMAAEGRNRPAPGEGGIRPISVLRSGAGTPESGDRPISLAQRRDAQTRQGRRRDRKEPSRPRHRSVSVSLYAARILIFSLGVGVLAGTLLSTWNPAGRSSSTAQRDGKAVVKPGEIAPSPALNQMPTPGEELVALKAAIQPLLTRNPQLTAGIFFMDLDNNAYLDVNGGTPLAAASTIKIPILVAFLQDVDAGKIRLDDKLTLRKELVANGSGELQYQPLGTQLPALEVASKMITVSDNTATNLLIDRMGGVSALNQRFKSWGLTATSLSNPLPDLEGTNTSSARDMSLLMARLSQGELVSLRSRDRLRDIMQQTITDSLLPRGLGAGATIAHKTGDIGTLVGDVGLIDLPNGKRYVAAVLVKRSFNDERANELIRQISRTSYQYFMQPSQPTPGTPATSAAPTPAASPTGTPVNNDATQANNPSDP